MQQLRLPVVPLNPCLPCITLSCNCRSCTWCRSPPAARLAHQHAVFLWVTCILNDGDDVGALLRHVDKVTPTPAGHKGKRKKNRVVS